MKAIFGAILIGLVLIGSAAAQGQYMGFNTDYSTWAQFPWWNLIHATPAFAAGWGLATASAGFDPDVYGIEGLKPYTSVAIVFSDPNGAAAKNWRVDPTANMNLTVVSTSGLGATNITTAAVIAGTQKFDSYASAAGVAFTDVSAIRNAWTAGAFEVRTIVDPTSSNSMVIGSAAAIADHVHWPPFP